MPGSVCSLCCSLCCDLSVTLLLVVDAIDEHSHEVDLLVAEATVLDDALHDRAKRLHFVARSHVVAECVDLRCRAKHDDLCVSHLADRPCSHQIVIVEQQLRFRLARFRFSC